MRTVVSECFIRALWAVVGQQSLCAFMILCYRVAWGSSQRQHVWELAQREQKTASKSLWCDEARITLFNCNMKRHICKKVCAAFKPSTNSAVEHQGGSFIMRRMFYWMLLRDVTTKNVANEVRSTYTAVTAKRGSSVCLWRLPRFIISAHELLSAEGCRCNCCQSFRSAYLMENKEMRLLHETDATLPLILDIFIT